MSMSRYDIHVHKLTITHILNRYSPHSSYRVGRISDYCHRINYSHEHQMHIHLALYLSYVSAALQYWRLGRWLYWYKAYYVDIRFAISNYISIVHCVLAHLIALLSCFKRILPFKQLLFNPYFEQTMVVLVKIRVINKIRDTTKMLCTQTRKWEAGQIKRTIYTFTSEKMFIRTETSHTMYHMQAIDAHPTYMYLTSARTNKTQIQQQYPQT